MRVEDLAAQGHRPAKIAEIITTEALAEGMTDPPVSERTARRIYERWKQRPDSERRVGEICRWPDAMQSGALPWDAGRAFFELLAYRELQNEGRPTVREVRWFYRLRLAMPHGPTEMLVGQAHTFAQAEYDREKNGAVMFVMPDADRLLALTAAMNDPNLPDREQVASAVALKRISTSVTLTAQGIPPLTITGNLTEIGHGLERIEQALVKRIRKEKIELTSEQQRMVEQIDQQLATRGKEEANEERSE